ncbi:MAG: DUF3333 domain-containing protein, partial [Gammaproteobacteria bacterium]|nr:DUF3333 domain-containing protein [Gammaproteobacteria bacterium]
MSGEDTRKRVEASLKSRYRRENRFRLYGVVSIVIGISFLGFLFFTIVGNGIGAFQQTFIQLDIEFDSGIIDPDGTRDEKALKTANYSKLIQSSLLAMFPEASGRRDRRALKVLVSGGASYELRDIVLRDPEVIGTTQSLWLLADDEVDMFYKGYIDRDVEQGSRRFKDNQIGWLDALAADGRVRKQFNTIFFTAGDSREPELAGIWGATKGSFFMLLVTLILSFPLGVAAALYLEEFAPRNRWVDLIE